MIRNHPRDEHLVALAAGLPGGQAVVLGAHVGSCAYCRERLRTLESIGGGLLEQAEPHPLAADALTSTLRRIAQEAPAARFAGSAAHTPAASLPPGVAWPASLRGCRITPWRWIGPGRRISRVQVPHDPAASVFLLSIDPGRSLPWHRHAQLELTQVLCGSFTDGQAVFGPGDFDTADHGVHHQPVVQPGSVCVCLTWVEGRLQFDGRMAAAMARWLQI